MPTETSSSWLFASMAVGAVGAGYLVYGIRQKEPWPLGVGVLLSVIPFLIADTIMLLALSALLILASATRTRWLP